VSLFQNQADTSKKLPFKKLVLSFSQKNKGSSASYSFNPIIPHYTKTFDEVAMQSSPNRSKEKNRARRTFKKVLN